MTTTPAGWYQDPEAAPGDLRYWDGASWTDHRHPAAHPAPPPAAPSSVAGPPADVPGASTQPPPSTPPFVPVAPPAASTPPPGSMPPPVVAAPGASVPPGPPTKRNTGAIIAIIAVVLVVIIGGAIGAIAIFGGGSSSKSPSAWASSFCKKLEPAAVELQAQSESIADEDLDAIAVFLDDTADFLTTISSTMKDLGAPDIDGGEQMVDQLTANLDTAAKLVRNVAKDTADGDLAALEDVGTLTLDEDLGPRAAAAWDAIQDEMSTSSSCATLEDVFS